MISDLVRPARTVRELLDAAELAYGAYPAICMDSASELTEVDYSTFVKEVRSAACYFARNYGKRKIVALPGNMSPAWLTVFLCILYSGNIAVPMDLMSAEEDTIRKVTKLKPDMLFTENAFPMAEEKLKESFPSLEIRSVESLYERCKEDTAGGMFEFEELRPDDTAILIFTSGTTGDNKIVELTHRNVCADALLSVTYLDSVHGISARVLSALPMFHMYGITAPIFGSVYRGFTQCLGGGAWSLKKDLQKFRPEILLVVPVIIYNFGKKLLPAGGATETMEESIARVAMAKQFFGGNLKTVITGGAPLDPGYSEFFSKCGAFLMNGYGITECSPIVSCDIAILHKDGAIGKTGIMPELCSVKIMEDEICIKGEIVSPGYWNEQELNSMVYEDGWFKTGDMGRLDEDGFLYITGRKKNILILPDGNNISLDELEAQICECPEVDSAIVIGSVVNGNAVMEAVVYAVPGNGKTEEENMAAVDGWISKLNGRNRRFKRIAGFRMTDKPFERTALGKIQKYKYQTTNGAGCK